ncbi:hypothetical protein CEXT_585541 [Caerostris extrusa]|uniref:Uncharacterized protein n=1 Tax=Caerostris extrusa TaxID=172846 RepID=A0AAV4Y295_CAEEX|nr:hypothetical protein CEXT_585541 [Caerostris extrusa]
MSLDNDEKELMLTIHKQRLNRLNRLFELNAVSHYNCLGTQLGASLIRFLPKNPFCCCDVPFCVSLIRFLPKIISAAAMFPSMPNAHLWRIKSSDLFPPLCFVIPPGEKSELFFVGSPGSEQIPDSCASTTPLWLMRLSQL